MMKQDDFNTQTTADLVALAAVSQGNAVAVQAMEPADEDRMTLVAQLREQYKTGRLPVDEKALASKLVEVLLRQP